MCIASFVVLSFADRGRGIGANEDPTLVLLATEAADFLFGIFEPEWHPVPVLLAPA
jgi:hypothetical protein